MPSRMWKGVLIGAAAMGMVCALMAVRVVRAGDTEKVRLARARGGADDLEISGMVAGLQRGESGYVSRKVLLGLPGVEMVVTGDPDLGGVSVRARGVRLSALEHWLGAEAGVDLVDTPCSDGYRSYFPAEMIRAHEPILVLTLDGMTPREWAAKAKVDDPGPYLVVYDGFKPAWRVLAHEDRPQLPTNVVRVEFGTKAEVFGRIAPGKASVKEQEGYEIARQNCIRCHARGATGGTKSGVSWERLGRDARARPEWFMRVVKDPKAVNGKAEMPGDPEYDAATLEVLRRYFLLQLRREAR